MIKEFQKGNKISTVLSTIKILTISFILLVILDIFFGNKFISFITKNSEREYRKMHHVYSHTLKENFIGTGKWGNNSYQICTNKFGFKSSCIKENLKSEDSYDYIFIGDSFTEAIGIPHEKTFTGLTNNYFTNLKIANMGVASYSPSIYFSKLSHFIKNGLKIKNVVVFIDPGDYFDEMKINLDKRGYISYKTNKYEKFKNVRKLKSFINNNFSGISYFLNRFISKKPTYDNHTNFNPPGIRWVNENFSSNFTKNDSQIAIQKSLTIMNKLYEFLLSRDITLSIGVYPWPYQIKHDKIESKHVKIWKKFCINKCKEFINSHKSIFKLKNLYSNDKLIKMLYIEGDNHFNEIGNQIIANDIIKVLNSKN